MKAAIVEKPGGLDRLKIVDRPDPGAPGPGEIRVRIHACSLNFHDYSVVSGRMPCEDGRIPMADGAGVDEIRSFATLLIQSDKLGTSISSTLRVYAGEMREARRMRAEEKAHRLPVIISIPLVTCMLPTMIGVLILPAAVAVIREVGPALTGG